MARGNRKDIRNAVEAARAAQPAWAAATAYNRAQVLYYLAENLEAERQRVQHHVGSEEFELAIHSLFDFAAMADKFDGSVHHVPMRALSYTLNEPIGVIGVVCPPEMPLLGMVAPLAGAIAMGNSVVVLPSEGQPLPAVELYRVLEASDVPGGVVNIVTGLLAETLKPLAEHDGVDALWCIGHPERTSEVERLSIGNLKQTWCPQALPENSLTLLRHATQVKNVWTPYGA